MQLNVTINFFVLLRIAFSFFHISALGIIRLVHTQNFRKNQNFLPLIRTRTCMYEGIRKVSFSEDFAYVFNG